MYADYAFYTGAYYGTAISEADFPRLSSRATDFLDYYTRNRAKVYDPDAGGTVYIPLQKACCAIAEQMRADEQSKALAAKAVSSALASSAGEVKSESVGSWSASYTTAADYMSQNTKDAQNAASAAYAVIATQYLANTGLLYRGGCFC